jgi:hypothetical protein
MIKHLLVNKIKNLTPREQLSIALSKYIACCGTFASGLKCSACFHGFNEVILLLVGIVPNQQLHVYGNFVNFKI